MLERDRISLKRFKQEFQEEQERPIRELEAQMNEAHRKIAAVQRDTLLNDGVLDQDLFVSPEVYGASMPQADAYNYNLDQLDRFAQAHPEIAGTKRNIEMFGSYFQKHGLNIITFEMLEKLYQRFLDAGIEFDRREPEPEQIAEREPIFVNLAIAPSPGPKTYTGRDCESGLDREFTEWEIDRMSSEQYRRAFRIAPTVTELFISMDEQR